MDLKKHPWIYALLFFFLPFSSAAQDQKPVASGGGPIEIPKTVCLPETERLAIRQGLQRNVAELRRAGKLPVSVLRAAPPLI